MRTDRPLTLDLQDELQWVPAAQAGQTQVQCSASVVRLTGALPGATPGGSAERAVRRVAGRALASHVAWCPPGVCAVHDRRQRVG